MTTPDLLASQQAFILERLAAAGARGLPKGQLRVNTTVSGRRYGEALRVLENQRQIGNLGTAIKSRYVLMLYFLPLELAYEAMLARALKVTSRGGAIPLLSRIPLFEALPAGAIKQAGEEALSLLQQEGKLVAVKWGHATLYFARQLLPAHLPPLQPIPAWETVVAAYQNLCQEQQSRDVSIHDLHQKVADTISLPQLQECLRLACSQGKAIPGRGDPSLASKKERKAGLEINGVLYLHLRLPA